jgi:hypothetical protein
MSMLDPSPPNSRLEPRAKDYMIARDGWRDGSKPMLDGVSVGYDSSTCFLIQSHAPVGIQPPLSLRLTRNTM